MAEGDQARRLARRQIKIGGPRLSSYSVGDRSLLPSLGSWFGLGGDAESLFIEALRRWSTRVRGYV